MSLVQGEITSTNLEGLDLDKIIIRQSFHHFSRKKEMLSSISKSLKPDGRLYVLEATKDHPDNYCRCLCDEAMRSKRIIKKITSNGFKLEEILVVGFSYLFVFRNSI